MRIFILALCGLFEVTVSAAEQGKIEPGGSARIGSVFRAEPAIFAGSARLENSSRLEPDFCRIFLFSWGAPLGNRKFFVSDPGQTRYAI